MCIKKSEPSRQRPVEQKVREGEWARAREVEGRETEEGHLNLVGLLPNAVGETTTIPPPILILWHNLLLFT